MNPYISHHDDDDTDDTPIEAYCVRCRGSVEVVDPVAVWTRKGVPATRGECPDCGGTVFRMGRTDKHQRGANPSEADAAQPSRPAAVRLGRDAVYVMFAPDDSAIARRIADDLNKIGVAAWLHGGDGADDSTEWATGVHPALHSCSRLIYVLSPAALDMEAAQVGWQFCREQRKPIIVAQVAPAPPPDGIRRSPRFDFTSDYKRAFRQMVMALQ
ncbi:MAG: toll/interleukin-1 receptor domain-containing protein [Anaerolineaceae bacterium]|nr:MAG: toll/interleukin-1 receptor domain-containing protein [Anaerolineaceae bacterium]